VRNFSTRNGCRFARSQGEARLPPFGPVEPWWRSPARLGEQWRGAAPKARRRRSKRRSARRRTEGWRNRRAYGAIRPDRGRRIGWGRRRLGGRRHYDGGRGGIVVPGRVGGDRRDKGDQQRAISQHVASQDGSLQPSRAGRSSADSSFGRLRRAGKASTRDAAGRRRRFLIKCSRAVPAKVGTRAGLAALC